MIESTITVGNIIEAVSIITGVIIVLVRQSVTLESMRKELVAMEKEIEKIAIIIVDNAVTQQRLLNVEEDIRDLRKGRGYIAEEIAGEYTQHGKLIKK